MLLPNNQRTDRLESAPDGTASPGASRPLPWGVLVLGLFLYPHLVLFQLRAAARWGRALLLVCIIGAACGLVTAAVQLPGLAVRAADWAEWLGAEVGALWLNEDRLYWESPEELPYTTRRDGVRVDFVAADTDFSLRHVSGPESRGVWLSSDQACVWWEQVEGQAVVVTLLGKGPGARLELARLWPEGGRIDGPDFRSRAGVLLLKMLPLLCLWHVVSLLLPVLAYSLFFSMIAVMFRGPSGAGGFRAVYTFHLYASVPPLIVAAVYAGVGLPFLDFSRLFVFAFIGYLFLVFAGRRRIERRAEKDGRRQ